MPAGFKLGIKKSKLLDKNPKVKVFKLSCIRVACSISHAIDIQCV